MQDALQSVPDAFPELNAGVLLLRKSDEMSRVLAQWLTLYEQELSMSGLASLQNGKGPVGQPFLRKVLYESALRLTVLTPEYNCTPWIGYLNKTVKIIHHTAYGRRVLSSEDLADFGDRANASRDKRVYMSTRGSVEFFVQDQPR